MSERPTSERPTSERPTSRGAISAPSAELAQVEVRSLRWAERLTNAAWVTYAVGTLAFSLVPFLDTHTEPMPIGLALWVLGSMGLAASSPFLTLAGLIAGRARNLGRASVSVENGALSITHAGELTEVKTSELRQGAVQPGGVLVVDDARGRRFAIDTTEARAAELLDALDLEPEKRRFVFRWSRNVPRALAFVGTLIATVFALAIPASLLEHTLYMQPYSCFLFTAPWIVAELVSRWAARRELAVGLDGIEAKSRRGKRLLRFADIDEVRDIGGSLEVKTKDGAVHRVLADPGDPAVAHALRERIREAWALARARAGKGTIASALLERGGQDLPAWRASVAKILTAATGFRGAAIGAAELTDVMDDASAPAEQRIAAAIALGSDPAHRPKVRVAAEASVSPRLRVALEQVAEGEVEDAVIEAALAERG